MKVLKDYISFEEVIKGSRFLSELIPCQTQNQARDIIKQQKTKYADATHVVHGFVVGNNAEVMGMSDDGEPSGTAGRPVLDVIKGRNCTNLILTVTRWFGGTLLGTGGLVKAYGNGAKKVLEAAENANLFEEYVEKKDFIFEAEYSLLKPVKLQLENFHIYDLQEDFGEAVTLSGQIQAAEYENMAAMLKNLSNGKIVI